MCILSTPPPKKKGEYPRQFVDHVLLLQDLKFEKGYFLVIMRLVKVIERLELLQRRMGADLLLLQTNKRQPCVNHLSLS